MLAMSAALRRRKVQCPKCREVITLPDPAEAVALAAPAAAEPAVATAQEDLRLAAIEARLAALEHTIEMMQATPHEAPATTPVARSGPPPLDGAGDYDLPRFRTWGSPPKRGPKPEPVAAVVAKPALPIEPELAETMIAILAEAAPGKAAFWAREGDAEALQFAEALADVFTRAGWTVTELGAHPLPPEERHLSLRMSAIMSEPKVVTTIHRAFGAAGFALAFEIDPARASNVPVVVLPRRPLAGEQEMIRAVRRSGADEGPAGNALP
jgi:hypothetical protein